MDPVTDVTEQKRLNRVEAKDRELGLGRVLAQMVRQQVGGESIPPGSRP